MVLQISDGELQELRERIAELEQQVAKLQQGRKCAKCGGTGSVLDAKCRHDLDCPACGGKGF